MHFKCVEMYTFFFGSDVSAVVRGGGGRPDRHSDGNPAILARVAFACDLKKCLNF
jgi:hypothetical protein